MLEQWCLDILADPVTKQPRTDFPQEKGYPDTRVFLPNTYGFKTWREGQDHYEDFANSDDSSLQYNLHEKEVTRPVYEHFTMKGDIIDIGGGAGSVREYLSDYRLVSVDPYVEALEALHDERKQAYSCFSDHLNFVIGMAEFLPFKAESFDWAHMRSMLDHVQVPDLCLLEARRVLKPGGHILIGMTVDGGKSGRINYPKEAVKHLLGSLGVRRYQDHHIWHPTYKGLIKLVTDNGFEPVDEFWQPHYKDRVVYLCARRT